MAENATMTKIKSYFGVTPPYVQFFMEFAGKQSDVSYRISLTVGHDTPLFAQQWGVHDGGWSSSASFVKDTRP